MLELLVEHQDRHGVLDKAGSPRPDVALFTKTATQFEAQWTRLAEREREVPQGPAWLGEPLQVSKRLAAAAERMQRDRNGRS